MDREKLFDFSTISREMELETIECSDIQDAEQDNTSNLLMDSMLGNEELKQLQKQVDRLNDIILKSDTVLFVWTLEENIPAKFVSDNVVRYGYYPHDFYNGHLKDYWKFIYEPDREIAKRKVYEARKKKLPEIKHRYRVKCSSGEIRWVEEWMFIETDETGKILEEKGFVRDITEEVYMNEKIIASEKRFRSMYENTSVLIFSCSAKGIFIDLNTSMAQFLDAEKGLLLGTNIKKYLGEDAKKEFEAVAMHKNSSIQGLCEWQYFTKEGVSKVLKMNFAKDLDEQGNLLEIQFYAEDITEQREKDRQIRYLSEHDALTKLYNRRFFDEALKELCEKKEYPFSLIIGDINGLKMINDAFGHEMGDRYLVYVADIIVQCIRKEDIPVRLGGDEFAIILKNADEKIASKFVLNLKKAFERSKFDAYIKPSVAMSYAVKSGEELSVNDLYRVADEKMYKNKLNEGKSIRSSIISSLLVTLDKKTSETKVHGDRIKKLALEMGKEMGLEQNLLDELGLAAMMHDIGKISISAEILLKTGALSEAEWQIIKRHPETGYHILLASPNLASVGEIVLCHHERWDGKGYPRGLKAEQIPILARVIAICDSYDVMTHDRPYKKAYSKGDALMEMNRSFGSQFDPNLYDVFLNALAKLETNKED